MQQRKKPFRVRRCKLDQLSVEDLGWLLKNDEEYAKGILSIEGAFRLPNNYATLSSDSELTSLLPKKGKFVNVRGHKETVQLFGKTSEGILYEAWIPLNPGPNQPLASLAREEILKAIS